MQNVPDVKEESITDYLVWKWRVLDKRFKYINVRVYSRQEESSTTGADFEMELWLVRKKSHFPLVFQAKKFVKSNDSIVAKLRYPKGTQQQLSTLLAYAKSQTKLPFYMIYSFPDPNTKTLCQYPRWCVTDTAVFTVDAYTIKEFADGKRGTKVSKNMLLEATNPFHCMFCCPLSQCGRYFPTYFSALTDSAEARQNETLPNYVRLLLSESIFDLKEEEMRTFIDQNELRKFRTVGVYDMRDSN